RPARVGVHAAVVEMVARSLSLRPVRMGLAQPGALEMGADAQVDGQTGDSNRLIALFPEGEGRDGGLDATDDARLRLAPPPQPLPAGEGTKMWPAPPTPPRWEGSRMWPAPPTPLRWGRDKNAAGPTQSRWGGVTNGVSPSEPASRARGSRAA